MCKVIEKIVNFRLIWFLEKINYLTPFQSGFRKNRSTYDNLTIIKEEAQKALQNKQILGLLSIDISKAYDVTWRHYILLKLNKVICKGNMLNFITNFLKNRTFQVKTSNQLSDTFTQENGVPQGSALSVTLFLVAINKIDKQCKFPIKSNIFADDANFSCRSNNIKTVQYHLQETAKHLEKWSAKTGFSFSIEKSNCITFTRKSKVQNTLDTSDTISIQFNLIDNSLDMSDLSISTAEIDESVNTWESLEGRRIIDVRYVFETIQSIKHLRFDCTFRDLKFSKETRSGFFSLFYFVCKICGAQEIVKSENPNSQIVNVNMAMVSSIVNIGKEYSQLEEFSTRMNMFNMSNKLYQDFHNNIFKHLNDLAWKEMLIAGQEEAKLAIEKGEVDHLGRPKIAVVADGVWSKRSYTTHCPELLALLVQKQKSYILWSQKQILCICQLAENRDEVAQDHICFKNWNSASTAMEADIIVEGFKQRPDENYGNVSHDPFSELTAVEIQQLKNKFMENLKLTEKQIIDLEIKTERQHQLFGKLCKIRQTTSREKVIKEMLYGTFSGNAATRYGITHEDMAKEELEKIIGKKN
ncbi:hypothetical protein QTP88_019789 [Uroleucon formosanum]